MCSSPSRYPESSGDPASGYFASTAPSKPSSVVKTGLRSTTTFARAGVPDITGWEGSTSISTIDPLMKYSLFSSPAVTLRTGR